MLKKVLIIGGVVVAVAFGALILLVVLKGNGAFQVLAPAASEVKVEVDGKVVTTVNAGGYFRGTLEQGSHKVKLTSKTANAEYPVDVKNGTYDEFLPAPGQCTAVLDVTNFWYEKKRLRDHAADEVKVVEKHPAGKPFDAPSPVYYSFADLPPSVPANTHTNVMLDIPCALLAKSDKELIAAAMPK